MLVPFNRTAWALRDEMYRLAQTSLTCLLDRKKEVENPVFPEPFRVLCELGYQSQVMAAALARLAEAPGDTEALFIVAVLADELKEPLLGARAWDRIFAVVKAPTPSMFAVCAELQTEAKLYDDAERTYRILGTLLESPDLILTKLGQLEFNKGNYKKALETLQRAPLDTERLLVETDCYMRLRNYDKALERIRNAARITPALLEGRRFRLISANIADKANNMQYVEQMLAPLLTSRPPAPPDEDVPEAEIYIWSDMLDPNHNAHDNYYSCKGTFAGVWELIPKELVIACWHDGRKSMPFFSGLGFRTLGAAYYDADDLDGSRDWLQICRQTPGCRGIMYTSWQNKYQLLGPFGDMIRAAE